MAYLALQCPMGFPHISMSCQSVQGNTILTHLVNVCHPVVACDFCKPILCISDLTSWSARIVHILILIYFLKEYKGLSESLHFPDVGSSLNSVFTSFRSGCFTNSSHKACLFGHCLAHTTFPRNYGFPETLTSKVILWIFSANIAAFRTVGRQNKMWYYTLVII